MRNLNFNVLQIFFDTCKSFQFSKSHLKKIPKDQLKQKFRKKKKTNISFFHPIRLYQRYGESKGKIQPIPVLSVLGPTESKLH